MPIMLLLIAGFAGMYVVAVMLPVCQLVSVFSGSWFGPTQNPVAAPWSAASLLPVLLGVALLASHRLISGPRDRLRDDPVNLTLTVTGWVLIVVGLFGGFAGASLAGLSTLGQVPAAFTVLNLAWSTWLLWWLAVVWVLIDGLRMRRAAQQNALLWLLCVSAERFMPLAPAVAAFARERGGSFGRRVRRLAEMIETGVPLPEALAQAGRIVPPLALSTVSVGWQSGALAPALRQAAAGRSLDDSVRMTLTGKVVYVLLAAVYGLWILGVVMIGIVPQFRTLLGDSYVGLPSATRHLAALARFFEFWPLFALLCLPVALLLVWAALRHYGWIRWDPPGTGWLSRRLDAANVMDAMSLVAGQERPLWEGVASLAHAYPKPNVRWRLARAADDIEAGTDWAESLHGRGLIRRADLAILQAAQRAGNLPWALREMAQSNRRRFAYRLQAIAQTAFPVVVIFFGAVVAFIVVALFLPLVRLIKSLA